MVPCTVQTKARMHDCKEIAIAIKEQMLCYMKELRYLVSHGSSNTVPQYIVEEINALMEKITNAYGIDVDQFRR